MQPFGILVCIMYTEYFNIRRILKRILTNNYSALACMVGENNWKKSK